MDRVEVVEVVAGDPRPTGYDDQQIRIAHLDRRQRRDVDEVEAAANEASSGHEVEVLHRAIEQSTRCRLVAGKFEGFERNVDDVLVASANRQREPRAAQ
jgi:hypothetical protein